MDDYSYNGMISFVDPSKQGLIKINLFDSVKFICLPDNTDVDKDAIGRSVCRQIGYTSASSVLTSEW